MITGKSDGDYFNFVCECGAAPMTIRYLGLDPTLPRIHLTCEKCGKRTYYKIGKPGAEGFTRAPAGHDEPLNPETLEEYPRRR